MAKFSFHGLVQKLQRAFGHPAPTKPVALELERVIKRSSWTLEEIVELLQQTSKDEAEFDEAIVALKASLEASIVKSKGDSYNATERDTMIGQVDALVDQLVFVFGSLVEMGVDPEPFFKIVMDANMAKLGPDGKPILRPSDNKIMKPEGWEPPEPKMEKYLDKLLAESKAG